MRRTGAGGTAQCAPGGQGGGGGGAAAPSTGLVGSRYPPCCWASEASDKAAHKQTNQQSTVKMVRVRCHWMAIGVGVVFSKQHRMLFVSRSIWIGVRTL